MVAERLLQQTQQCAGGDEELEDDLDEGLVQQLDEHEPSGTLCALCRNAITKAKLKDKGKGSEGKGGKGRKCFECDSENHIAANCPKRAARVAAGGPERLPRDGNGKGDV